MMHGRGKSDEAIVAVTPANKAERSIRCGVGGAKGRGQGKCVSARHGPDTELGNRDTGAGAHTSGRWLNQRLGVIPEVGAVCGKAARPDLCGGRGEILVPTATGFHCLAPAYRAMVRPRRLSPAGDMPSQGGWAAVGQ